jgi:hypothetical protein
MPHGLQFAGRVLAAWQTAGRGVGGTMPPSAGCGAPQALHPHDALSGGLAPARMPGMDARQSEHGCVEKPGRSAGAG